MKISKYLLITLALFITSTSFAKTYGGGTGEPNTPYQIWTPQQMNTIGLNSGDWNKCFILMADVNMATYTGTQYNIIGNSTIPFTGKFDGNNKKITNLSYSSTTKNYVGLFGYTVYPAKIKNLGVENVNITGNKYVGGLIAMNFSIQVSNCYLTGNVSGKGEFVGGLIGCQGSGIISDCYSIGSVNGFSKGGGLIGYNEGQINNCYTTGSVSGNNRTGGLIGEDNGESVSNCYSTGAVSGSGSSTGGLIGWQSSGKVSNCYATGSVSGYFDIGGLIGHQDCGIAMNCYSAGTVNGITAGGLIGYAYSYPDAVIMCFWDINSSGKIKGIGSGSSTGVYGRTTTEMKQKATFTMSPYLWDFVDETVNGPNDFWRMCVDGVDYPRLTWEYDNKGDFICPDGADFLDYAMLADKWLRIYSGKLTDLDIVKDGIINFNEYAIMAGLWKISDCYSSADYSGDGNINENDLLILGQNWLRTTINDPQRFDITADGKVDYEELNILAENWLQ